MRTNNRQERPPEVIRMSEMYTTHSIAKDRKRKKSSAGTGGGDGKKGLGRRNSEIVMPESFGMNTLKKKGRSQSILFPREQVLKTGHVRDSS